MTIRGDSEEHKTTGEIHFIIIMIIIITHIGNLVYH